MKKMDMIGKRFGNLKVIKKIDNDKHRRIIYITICKCGKIKEAKGYLLRRGDIKSCGCGYRTVKGLSKTKEAKIWYNMMRRCYNPKCSAYKSYGKQGIAVCERWHKLENFINDMGKCPDGYSIDRIDGLKGYSPDNCRWIPIQENKKHHKITYTKHK